MKKYILILLSISLAFPVPVNAGGLLSRLFGGGRRVQAVSCYQPTYQFAYQQQYNYLPVAAVPLATVPVAIDLQAYAYAVNAGAFQSFREYMSAKNAVGSTDQPSSPPEPPAPQVASEEDPRLAGATVLKKNCIRCHQQGNQPKKNFSIFDKSGNLYTNLPWGEMLERITSQDPEVRMPPKSTLASHDVMSIFRLASFGLVENQGVQTAANPGKITNPFD